MVFPNSTKKCFHKNGRVSIVVSTYEHAQYLQNKLKTDDLYECFIHGVTPFIALHQPIKEKDGFVFTALYDNQPVAMFGVANLLSDDDLNMGTVWMLGTNELYKIQKSFIKTTKEVVDWLMTKYDIIENIVPVQNIRTIKWLKLLKFSVSSEKIKVNNCDCYHFVRCISGLIVSSE